MSSDWKEKCMYATIFSGKENQKTLFCYYNLRGEEVHIYECEDV